MTMYQQRSSTRRLEKFNSLLLSDSICKYMRPEKVSSNNIEVKVSYESGCDCSRMLKFLEQQQLIQTSIFQADFVLFSLCINDVANLCPNLALQNCRVLIERVKELFPRLKLIGWLVLSPRSKLSNELPEIFDEWLPAPTPGQKRKLGHRQDDPPTPPSSRLPPPPINPRKTLLPRNHNAPLVGESLPPSPINDAINYQKQ
ncbi:unnamed protein product [Rotaria magnacalcarata]|uniref:Uncharacterized protein n=1 Tax=Rotaria magnacalcarata TaxID=392030 RepID=A0A816MSI6_9BILA|nr:unnamed protein product [Rotaria magnacalcarata]